MFPLAERRAGAVGGVISTTITKGRTHRDRGSAIGDPSPSRTGDEPLSANERQELMRLRREMAELQKDNAFLGMPTA